MNNYEVLISKEIQDNYSLYGKYLYYDFCKVINDIKQKCIHSYTHSEIFSISIFNLSKNASYNDYQCIIFTIETVRKNEYRMRGYLTPSGNQEYFADLTFHEDDGWLEIADNYVKRPEMRNKGVGSIGMDCIKQFADKLGCIKIIGTKQPIPNTQEEMDKLMKFYAKNGFTQSNTSSKISFDMSTYRTGEKNK